MNIDIYECRIKSNRYNCSGPPAFKSQRVGYQSNQKSLHHYQHQKIIKSFLDTAYFRVLWTKRPWPWPFSTTSILNSSNLIGWQHFVYVSGTRFSQYGICVVTQKIKWIFIIEQIQWKFITKYFFKFKKSLFLAYFWLISQILGAKKFFRKILALSSTSS